MLAIGKEFELIDHHDGNNFRGEVRCHRGDVRNDNERKIFCVEALLQGVQIADLCKSRLKGQDQRPSCRIRGIVVEGMMVAVVGLVVEVVLEKIVREVDTDTRRVTGNGGSYRHVSIAIESSVPQACNLSAPTGQ